MDVDVAAEGIDAIACIFPGFESAQPEDAAGDEVTGETWPLSMPYVSASNGRYKATLSDVLAIVPNKRYQAVIVADAGASKKRTWYFGVNAIRG